MTSGGGTVLHHLAEHAVRLRAGLDSATSRAAVRAVVDWYAATVPGGLLAPARLLTASLHDPTSTGPARLVPSGLRTDTRTAALINGTAAHTAELDDIYREGLYHPGAPTISAALAVGQALDRSGAELTRAVAVGYEVGCRLAEAVNPSHYLFWHTTGTIGTIGAAAAVADLLELDEPAVAHALATAATTAAGLQQAFRSDAMSKALHAGHAADYGTVAAMAAGQGFTGALDVVDGDRGLAAATAPGSDISRAMAAPGGPPRIQSVTVKPHACCGHTFAAVDAALAVRGHTSVDDIDRIEVATYATALEVATMTDPRSAFEAKFSIGYCVAAAFVLGTVGLPAFEPQVLTDPSVRRLMARIEVRAEADLTARYPHQRSARIVVADKAGHRWSAHRDTRHGDPDDPLTDDELRRKYTETVQPVFGPRRSAALLDMLWNLPELDSVRRLAWGPAEGA